MVRHQNEEKMSERKELIKLDDVKSIAEFLQQPATKMAEFITGLLVSDTKCPASTIFPHWRQLFFPIAFGQ